MGEVQQMHQWNRHYTALALTSAFAVAVVFAPVLHAEEELERREFLDGRVSMLVPMGFGLMSEEMLQIKYPNDNRPSIVLSDSRGTVNVAMDHKSVSVEPTQIAGVYSTLERTFKNLYPSATWNRSEVVVVGGRTWAVLDLFTPAIDGEIRNIMMVTSLEGRLLVISFNCTRDLNEKWGLTGEKVMNSIVLSPKSAA